MKFISFFRSSQIRWGFVRPILVCCILVTAGSLVIPAKLDAATEVEIVAPPQASRVEKFASQELTVHLQAIYPHVEFLQGNRPAAKRPNVFVGTRKDSPELLRPSDARLLEAPESFVVYHQGATAAIVGSDARGVLYGVYALLEKLGYGFYLSYTAAPPPGESSFSFEGWDLADHPLVAHRLVFNWHNFLSGCSTWNLVDWQNWITQSARMRFNAIMVHAYGNNPMFAFTHNGVEKPTGYLTTTARGRDWGTEHVLDVRTMVGAAGLFDSPVFGADAAMAPEGETHEAATALMRQVFQFAADHGMGITFALDVDTVSANPQNIIATLPATARFAAGDVQLANPETPEGYAYYRSQIAQLLQAYPQITQIAVWFRGQRNSPWRGLTPRDFSQNWADQYASALKLRPDLNRNDDSPSMFAIGKIAAAFRRALDETGHANVGLAAGSWRFDFLAPAAAFMPAKTALIPLDYSYQFASDPVQEQIRAVSRRPVIPIVWAQHDDRSFAGRPYIPFPGFASLLRSSGSQGYGIIHWTTRPLDLYFKNLADQVWSSSRDETLDGTCEAMAECTFGHNARDVAKRYLLDWIQDAPQFGRETTDKFIDQYLPQAPALEGCARRLSFLQQLELLAQSPGARNWVGYFEDWERFVELFYRAQGALQRSLEATAAGNFDDARRQIAAADPEAAVQQYARTIRHGETTRGEKGILVSLNLRWLPYFAAERQRLGMEPLRVRFAPTSHETLAQMPGQFTYAFDAEKHIWRVLGAAETGGDVRGGSDGTPCSGGLEVNSSISLTVSGLGAQPLPDGAVQTRVDTPPGQHVTVSNAQVMEGKLHVTFTPIAGAASVCGLTVNFSPSTIDASPRHRLK